MMEPMTMPEKALNVEMTTASPRNGLSKSVSRTASEYSQESLVSSTGAADIVAEGSSDLPSTVPGLASHEASHFTNGPTARRRRAMSSDDEDGLVSEEDTVTGDWSIASENDDPPPELSQADIEVCQRLDREYENALEERDIAYSARFHSVRQSACFSVAFMLVYLTLGTVFFLQQADWNTSDALLFSIYTITTVGFGHLEHPETPAFQIYTIFFIFIGIATLTMMVAQVYQCLALEATRAQHARDQSEMARRGMEILSRNAVAAPDQANSANEIVLARSGHAQWVECLWQVWDQLRHFFTYNEVGRGISVIFPFLGLILVGAVVIGPIEGWSVIESLYFAVVSLTTVGYGDYYPTRTASTWFCIVWLPFSVGFMSLFLANVAAFYIRLSDKNIDRIEQQLRRQVAKGKERLERERAEARRRALRGQEHRDVVEGTDSDDDDEGLEGAFEEGGDHELYLEHGVQQNKKRRGGFATLPTDEVSERASRPHGSGSGRHLFGSKNTPTNRREVILANSNHAASEMDTLPNRGDRPLHRRRKPKSANSSYSSDDDSKRHKSSMTTMRDILRTVRRNLAKEKSSSSEGFRLAGPESEFLSIRSSKTVRHTLHTNSIRKPSFALRALVQERFSEIIAIDIAGYSSSIEIHENTLTMTIDSLKQTADKWLIPRRARKAFRAVIFEALLFVGEHGLITRGAEALYDLTPFEFHGLFAPLLAALGDAETMEGWLYSTEVLAEVDLHKSTSGGMDRAPDGKTSQPRVGAAERLQQARSTELKPQSVARVTPGSAVAAAKRSIEYD